MKFIQIILYLVVFLYSEISSAQSKPIVESLTVPNNKSILKKSSYADDDLLVEKLSRLKINNCEFYPSSKSENFDIKTLVEIRGLKPCLTFEQTIDVIERLYKGRFSGELGIDNLEQGRLQVYPAGKGRPLTGRIEIVQKFCKSTVPIEGMSNLFGSDPKKHTETLQCGMFEYGSSFWTLRIHFADGIAEQIVLLSKMFPHHNKVLVENIGNKFNINSKLNENSEFSILSLDYKGNRLYVTQINNYDIRIGIDGYFMDAFEKVLKLRKERKKSDEFKDRQKKTADTL